LKLSIIIVNYRSWSFLGDCLDSLLADSDSDSWQIIVADNFSNDGEMPSFVDQYQSVQFIKNEKNAGFAYGCNAGARVAEGDLLLFLNPDVIVRPGQVRQLLDVKQSAESPAILTACQINAKGQAQKTWDIFPNLFTYLKSVKSLLRNLMPSRFPNPRTPHSKLMYCDWVSGAVFLISRQDFQTLGGWCEDYWLYSEDCDLCYLAAEKGMKVACTSEVTFLHHHGGASRQTKNITVLTKAEAIISKHVFNNRHRRGFLRAANHALIILANVPELIFWTILDALTLRNFKALSIRRGMLAQILEHYGRVIRTGDWRSKRVQI
jgi:GT2 family glycosyltransferase